MAEILEPAFTRDGLTYRPRTDADVPFVADVFSQLDPEDPQDPKMLAYRWRTTNPEWILQRYIVEEGGRPVGYALWEHAPWEKMPEHYGGIRAELLRSHREADRMGRIFDLLEEKSRADGARTFTAGARSDDPFFIEFLQARGYHEDRRGKAWQLDLVKQRGHLEAMAQRSRARMRQQGVRMLTLAEDPDPQKYRQIWLLSEAAAEDVPTTVPHVPEPFEQFVKWFEAPGIREDRLWIARKGGELVGISVLSYPPTRGCVWTAWTATSRSVRGQGVARALKCETVMQAIALGVWKVRTGNDAQNAPILHINEDMGYENFLEWIDFHKPA